MFSHSPEAGDPGAGRAGPLQLGGGSAPGPSPRPGVCSAVLGFSWLTEVSPPPSPCGNVCAGIPPFLRTPVPLDYSPL